jgi:fibronectin-binding autotransporter adhesin
MTGTTLTNTGSTLVLSNYGTGNPFYVAADTTITAASGDAIYGDSDTAWVLTNAGTISATASTGIVLAGAGTITNVDGAEVDGGTGAAGDGTTAEDGGPGGQGWAAILLSGDATITNAGRLQGGTGGTGGNGNGSVNTSLGGNGGAGGAGVDLSSGSTMINQASGVLAGGNGGDPGFGAFFDGNLGPDGDGADLSGGATLNNAGMVSGQNGIVANGNGNTVINSGTIIAFESAVQFTGDDNLLVVETGAVFEGAIVADGAANTLAFGGVATKQTISGIGSTYVGFTILGIEKSASWSLSQTVGFDALTVEAAGTLGIESSVILTVSGSGSTIAGTIAGAGILRFAGGSQALTAGAAVTVADWEISGTDTVSFDASTKNAARIADDRNTTLTFASGTTTTLTANGSTFGGALKGSGTLNFTGGTQAFNSGAALTVAKWNVSGAASVIFNENFGYGGGFTDAAGTTLLIVSGTAFSLTGTGSALAGNVVGQGSLIFAGGSQAVGSGALIATKSWQISGKASTTLNESLTYGGTFAAAATSTLTVASGKTLSLSGTSTLAGTVSGAGTLSFGVGTQTLNTGASLNVAKWSVGAGASVTVKGAVTATSTLADAAGGAIAIAANGTLTLNGAVSGAGTVKIGAGATLETGNAVAASQGIAFTAGTGTLEMTAPAAFAAAIAGFKTGDVLDLRSSSFAYSKSETLSFVENTAKTKGVLTVADGAHNLKLTLFGQYVAAGFEMASDGHGGTAITYAAAKNVETVMIAGAH